MYSFLLLGTIFNTIVGIISGIFTYSRDPQNPINRTFAIFCFFMSLWAAMYFFPAVPYDKNLSELSFRMLHIGAIFIAVAHFHFVACLLKIQEQYKYYIRFGYLINLCFVCTVPTTLFIEEVVFKFDFGYWANTGILYHFWLAIWMGYILLSLIVLAQNYSKHTGIRQRQIAYVLIGDVLTFGFGSTNFFLFYDINIVPTLNVLASGQMILFAYVVIRFRFFEYQRIILDFLQKVISFFLALACTYLVFFYVNEQAHMELGIRSDIIFLTTAILFYNFFTSIIKVSFFEKLLRLSNTKHFAEEIQKFINQQSFHSQISPLKKAINHTFRKELNISKANLILIPEKDRKNYKHLCAYFQKNKAPLVFEEVEIKAEDSSIAPPFYHELKDLGEVCIPLCKNKKKLFGFFVLGKKPYENPYFAREIEALEKAANYISLSLSVIYYNQKLTDEVQEKTEALQKTNIQLTKSYDRLRELDHLKDDFLSIASHELRTPMSIIKGYTDFLLSGDYGKLNTKQTEFVQRIFNSTNDLIQLVNKMLDISKLESGKMEFNSENIKLTSFLKSTIKEFKVICKKKNITLTLKNTKKINPTVHIDPEKLYMVFSNLLGNAYKFTPENGHIEVKIGYKNKENILIEITDDGIGIPKDKQEYIFNKFQQAENPLQKSYSGSGLGLNIVKQIIEKFGGTIWIKSEGKVNSGSSFKFTLPYNES